MTSEIVIAFVLMVYLLNKLSQSTSPLKEIVSDVSELSSHVFYWPNYLVDVVGCRSSWLKAIIALVIWLAFGILLTAQFTWPWWRTILVYSGITLAWIVVSLIIGICSIGRDYDEFKISL